MKNEKKDNKKVNKQVINQRGLHDWKEYRSKPAVDRKTAKVKRELDKRVK